MNDKLFDKQIKAALDNLEVPYDSASWAALEQRLNAPFAEEQPAPVDAVDKAVFRTLERLEAPYQTAHWDMLANRMTRIVRQRRRVWMAKMLEAAIFLLLLVNLDGFLGVGTSHPPQPVVPQNPGNKHLQAEVPVSPGRRGDASLPAALIENGIPGSNENWTGIPPYLLPDTEDQNFEEIIALNPDGQTDGFSSENPIESAPEYWVSVADMMALPILAGQPVERVNASPYAGSTVQVKAPKQHRFYATTFASFDKNYVQSTGKSKTSNGYGGGMAIGYRIGKWGAEAGLSYNRRHYEPKKVIEIYDGNTNNGFYGSYAKNVDADVVSVPVKITRRIAQFGQTTIHAAAGVTTNIAVDKRYDYGSVFYPPVSQSGPPPPVPGQQPKLRKNGQGVFENGSLNGNVYASADLGVRVEQPIGRHIAAFVEPAYRFALGNKGIGPNPAKVNTFSVQAGLLTTL